MKNLLNAVSDWFFSKAALPYWCILIIDCLIVFISNFLLFSISTDASVFEGHWPAILGTLLLYEVFYLVGFKAMRTYSGIMRYSSFLDLGRIGCAMAISLVLLGACRKLFSLNWYLYPISLTMLVEACVLATAAMWMVRISVKFMYDVFFHSSQQTNVFIYGVKDGGISLAKSIRNQKPSLYNLRGFISDDTNEVGRELMAKPVFPIDENIVGIMQQKEAKILIVSPLKSEAFRENNDLQTQLLEAGIKIHMMPSMVEWDGKSNLSHTQLKEVDIEDLLPREQIDVDMQAIGDLLHDKTILITGSAGSIGSEMVRQVASFGPKHLVLIDAAETPQHDIRLMMARCWPDVEAHTIVTSITNESRMEKIFSEFRPEYVFHAAAYKHVPMMEDNPFEAVQNNIHGTQVIADMAVKYGVKKFVMISTDKAVNPTNVMGCSKRICEIITQSMDRKFDTQFVTTRFGNVLGSNGSVIPLFKEQIKNGGPVTVTHKDIIRYFMLIPEACKLVLEAGTMGNGGEIFVFDMGKPVKISDLAKRMIRLSGAQNIEMKYTGLRDGEKLYEEVLNDKEVTKPTVHPKIMVAAVRQYEYEDVLKQLDTLYTAARTYDDMAVVKVMKEIVPEFKSKHSKYEALD